ncbi:MAG: DM13 domain-containing protein [Kiloniellaceae bacterium]
MNARHFTTALGVAALVVFALSASAGAFAGDEVIARGSFTGKKGHATSGGVSVVKTAKGTVVVLDPDFSFDGAPDPKLGFGKNGYDKSAKFSVLRSNRGKQTYDIPASIDPADYNEIWVWCERYSVPLGVAKLK